VSGKVDVFTMAPHLMIPDPGITNFVELGLKHNPNMRFLIKGSWDPNDVAAPAAGAPDKRIKDNAQRDTMKIEDLQAVIDEWRKRTEAQVKELIVQTTRSSPPTTRRLRPSSGPRSISARRAWKVNIRTYASRY
jgi:hypothetical protein